MADVFISYHEQSAGDIAAKIAAALEEAGISCWYAKRDIPAGGDFARYIPPQIDACKVFLLILNEGVYQSNHIENEVGLAFSRLNKGDNIKIIPLEIGDFKRESWVRYYLVHTQSMKISMANQQHMQTLIEYVNRALCRTGQAQSTWFDSDTSWLDSEALQQVILRIVRETRAQERQKQLNNRKQC